MGLVLGMGSLACVEVTIPPEAGLEGNDGATDGSQVVMPPGSRRIVDGPDAGGPGLVRVDAEGASEEPGSDLPQSCSNHCECPAGLDCINERCVMGEELIQCCTHPDCPLGAACWSADGVEGACGT